MKAILIGFLCPIAVLAEISRPVGALQVPVRGDFSVNIICSGGFIQQPVYAGIGDVAGATLLDTAARWQPGSFAGSHYVLLDTGDWAGIRANTETRLDLEAPLGAYSEAAYRIIPYNTLAGMFGEDNFAGFTAGVDLAGSDILIPWDAKTQRYAGYYFYNALRNRWEGLDGEDAGGTILYPDEALIVIGKQDNTLTLHGTVQQGRLSGDIPGDGATTILPNPYPVDMVINEAGLENFIAGAGSFVDADWLMVWDPVEQTYSDFYYFDTDDSLWRDLNNRPAGPDDRIPPGTGLLVVRNRAGATRWSLDPPFGVR